VSNSLEYLYADFYFFYVDYPFKKVCKNVSIALDR